MDPLLTDEKLPPGSPSKKRDMDSAMLAGCTAFIVVSFISYGLTVWPFLVFQRTERLNFLIESSLLAFVPALIFGVISIRKAGLAGACGYFAGSMTTGVFVFLRLNLLFSASGSAQSPTPDYPEAIKYLLPGGWILICLATAIICLPKGEGDLDPDSSSGN